MIETANAHFTVDLRDLERKTAELEAQYDGLFKSISYHLYDYALDHDDTPQTCVSHVYAYTDHAVRDLVNSRLNTQPLDCRKSCAYCCHLTVKCPAQIVFHIAEHIRQNWSDGNIADLLERLDLYSIVKHSEGAAPPCPFLDTDAACRIYDVRPLSCRAFTSANVKLCQSLVYETAQTTETIPQHTLIYRVYEMATTALQGAALKQGRDKEQVLFQSTLAAALRDRSLEERWRTGALISELFPEPIASGL